LSITRKIKRALRGEVGVRAASLEAGRRVAASLRRRRERALLSRQAVRGAQPEERVPQLSPAFARIEAMRACAYCT